MSKLLRKKRRTCSHVLRHFCISVANLVRFMGNSGLLSGILCGNLCSKRFLWFFSAFYPRSLGFDPWRVEIFWYFSIFAVWTTTCSKIIGLCFCCSMMIDCLHSFWPVLLYNRVMTWETGWFISCKTQFCHKFEHHSRIFCMQGTVESVLAWVFGLFWYVVACSSVTRILQRENGNKYAKQIVYLKTVDCVHEAVRVATNWVIHTHGGALHGSSCLPPDEWT